MSDKNKILFKGSIDILPLLIPVVPFGIIFGAIGIELGFSALETFATSFIIFGGASQIVFLQLLSGGASNIITIASTFVVNLKSFVLNSFTSGAKFDFKRFRSVTSKAQRLMDDMIDLEIEQIHKILNKIEDDPEPDPIKQIEVNLWKKIKQ